MATAADQQPAERSDPAQSPTRRQRQTFPQFLHELQDGGFEDEITTRLHDLVSTMVVQADANGGKPKGQLKIVVDLQLDRGVFDVSADVSVKLPKIVRARTVMYGTRDGRISQTNPHQIDAFDSAKDVSTSRTTEVRSLPIR